MSYERLRERYANGETPWDHELPPPEVIAMLSHLPPGRALDLGCGYGRAAIYMAQQGWQVDAIDFIDLAIVGARQRAEQAGVSDQIQFHVGSVTDLHYLTGPYDFALDVGCMHNFDHEMLQAYRDEVARLLRPDGHYLLFAHLRAEPIEYDSNGRPRWLPEPLLYDLFTADFYLDQVEHGQTQMPDQAPWSSAWFWFRRRHNEPAPPL
jgi:cyclopropane fatty-acyl-phospholipid synthase-like methyltransferase